MTTPGAAPTPRRDTHLLAILLLLSVAAVYFMRDMLFPIMVGILLSLTLSPIHRALCRVGLPAPIAAFCVILVPTAAVAGLIYLLSGPFPLWLDELPRIGRALKAELAGLFSSLDAVQEASEQVQSLAEGSDTQQLTVEMDSPGLLQGWIAETANFGSAILIGTVMALILLGSGDLVQSKLMGAFRNPEDRQRAIRISTTIERRISRYLLAITLINAGLGVLVGVWLAILGIPGAVFWGIMAFALNFVPYLGGISGVAILAAVSIVEGDTLMASLLPPLGYAVLTTLEGQIVTPYLLGRSLALNTLSVFLAVFAWGWLWGIPGMLMAVPFLVFAKVIFENVPSLQRIAALLSPCTAAERSAMRAAFRESANSASSG